MMATGGLNVGIVATGETTLIAVAKSIRDLIEIRKFACSMEHVLMISYEKNKFAGDYITEEERIKNELPAPVRN